MRLYPIDNSLAYHAHMECMRMAILLVPALVVAATGMVQAASAMEFYIVTELGNTFPILDPHELFPGIFHVNLDGNDNVYDVWRDEASGGINGTQSGPYDTGQVKSATLAYSMAVNARLIHHQPPSTIVYGTTSVGLEVPLKSYLFNCCYGTAEINPVTIPVRFMFIQGEDHTYQSPLSPFYNYKWENNRLASAGTGHVLAHITGMPENTPYRVVTNLDSISDENLMKNTLQTGVTNSSGEIRVTAVGITNWHDMGLLLYQDSPVYRAGGPIGMIAFDYMNNHFIDGINVLTWLEPLGIDQKYIENLDADYFYMYSIQAYVRVPVQHDVTITDVLIDDKKLDYLGGTYKRGEALHIPVLPTYNEIDMTVNGIRVSMKISDVDGGTGLQISEPATNGSRVENPTDHVYSIESTTGTSAFMIADRDGIATAQVIASVSATSEIRNENKWQAPPPPPPPPRSRDPMTTWVEVSVNGFDLIRDHDGNYITVKKQIHFSDAPITDHESGVEWYPMSWHTSGFTYDKTVVVGGVSVPVREGGPCRVLLLQQDRGIRFCPA